MWVYSNPDLLGLGKKIFIFLKKNLRSWILFLMHYTLTLVFLLFMIWPQLFFYSPFYVNKQARRCGAKDELPSALAIQDIWINKIDSVPVLGYEQYMTLD